MIGGGRRGRQSGVIVPVALVASLLLALLAVALATLAGLEPAIARNLVDATRARLLAEAGLEQARAVLAAVPDWTDLLAGGATDDAVPLDTPPLPGLATDERPAAVRVRNDWRASDSALTGVGPDSGGRAADTNQHLVVLSTGQARRARRTVLAVARRVPLPVPPGAVAFTGPATTLAPPGAAVEIDGRDHALDGRSGACAPAWSIAVADAAAESAVEAAVPAAVASRLRGRAQDAGLADEGANTVAPDPGLDAAAIARFVAAARRHADVLVDARAGATTTREIGRACGGDVPGADCWGTPDRPRVVHVVGPSPDPTRPLLDVTGEGHGVLVIEDGAARITGDFRWHGLVIVTGRGAGLQFASGGAQIVLGGVVVDQQDGDGPGLVAGDARLLRSCAAIAGAARARSLTTLWGWQEVPLY